MDALDAIAAEGRRAGRLARPISGFQGEARRRQGGLTQGWLHGHDWLLDSRAVHEAGVRAYGRGAPRRVA